jgi:hypothetical protein
MLAENEWATKGRKGYKEGGKPVCVYGAWEAKNIWGRIFHRRIDQRWRAAALHCTALHCIVVAAQVRDTSNIGSYSHNWTIA